MSESDKPLKIEMIVFVLFAIFFTMWSFKRCEIEKSNARHNPRPASSSKKKTKEEKYSTLYVIVDSLNMRSAPHLDSMVVARLPRDTEVEFYGLRTSFRQSININNSPKNAPWVYIRNKAGQDGWIYAGGVNFYKDY